MRNFLRLGLLIVLILAACSNSRIDRIVYSTGSATPTSIKKFDWSYTGKTGPNYWGSLKGEYALCSKGKKQSPINIEQTVKATLPLGINYHSGEFKIEKDQYTLKLIPLKNSNSINIRGENFSLTEIHFHTPSEHLLNGKQSDLEIHFVHKDSNGVVAAIGVLVGAGKSNKEFQKILTSQKLSSGSQSEKIIKLNLHSFIPYTSKKVAYEGSYTTPPCIEGVKWIVYTKPIEFSDKQIRYYQNLFYPSNRPPQPINGRILLESW